MGIRGNSMLRHSPNHGILRLHNYVCMHVRKTDIISERVSLILYPNNISLSFQKTTNLVSAIVDSTSWLVSSSATCSFEEDEDVEESARIDTVSVTVDSLFNPSRIYCH